MKTIPQILTLWLLLRIVLGQTFVPMEYSGFKPYHFGTDKTSVTLQMPLCSIQPYIGCKATVEFNQPFSAYDIPDGTYLNFTATSSKDNCGTILCKNDPTSSNPSSCSFIYTASIGDKIYVSAVSGNAPTITATFQMRTDCGKRVNITEEGIEKRERSGLKECPKIYDSTIRTITLLAPGRVKTSSHTSDAVKYAINICPDLRPSVSLRYNLLANDPQSAFASFMCRTTPCDTNNSPPGWFDNRGIAFNSIGLTNLGNQNIYLSIYGWGEYLGWNSFVFNVELSDS